METRTSLLRLAGQADPIASREFVALYEPLIVSYARKRGPAGVAAADVAQEVFARLVKALPGFRLDRDRGRFRSWLYRVTTNAMADLARRDVRRAGAEREWARSRGVEADDGEPEWDRLYRRRVLNYALGRVREQTHPRTWDCFDRHILHGRPSAEVGAELGLKPGAVDTNCSRVLARLRKFTAEHLEELAHGVDPVPEH